MPSLSLSGHTEARPQALPWYTGVESGEACPFGDGRLGPLSGLLVNTATLPMGTVMPRADC